MNESRLVQRRKHLLVDEELHRATIAVLREQGWEGLTLERVAQASGRARSTLWRQGLTLEVLVSALVGELAADFRDSMYPILTIGGTGRDRLERAPDARPPASGHAPHARAMAPASPTMPTTG